MKAITTLIAGMCIAGALTVAYAHDEHGHEATPPAGKEPGMVTVTGEVIDMACYLDHGAMGAKHAACAKTCIESGLPVGIRAANGTTYLVIGSHQPINAELAQYAAKTITLRGKLVTRDGFNMLENAEVVRQ
jgi:hypothetical protein